MPEGVLRVPYANVSCQARLPFLSTVDGIIGFKTCANLDRFDSEAYDNDYSREMAFNQALYLIATGHKAPVRIIAAETREPYRVGVWLVGDTCLVSAEHDNRQALEKLKRYRANDIWPTGYEKERHLN